MLASYQPRLAAVVDRGERSVTVGVHLLERTQVQQRAGPAAARPLASKHLYFGILGKLVMRIVSMRTFVLGKLVISNARTQEPGARARQHRGYLERKCARSIEAAGASDRFNANVHCCAALPKSLFSAACRAASIAAVVLPSRFKTLRVGRSSGF